MSNQPEPMLKNSTHFAISAMMWFKGSRRFDALELHLGDAMQPGQRWVHVIAAHRSSRHTYW